MRITHKPYRGINIGFFVTFALTKQEKSYTTCREISPLYFRTTVNLPEGKPEKWLDMFVEAIVQLQKNGTSYPVRMNADNALDFFTIRELEQLDKMLINIPVALYNFKAAVKPKVQMTSTAFAEEIEKQDTRLADKTYSLFLLNDKGWQIHKPYQSLNSAKEGARKLFEEGIWQAVSVVDRRQKCPVFTLGKPQLK